MNIGPIQLVVVGFERTDRFRGEILRELEELRTGDVIRVLDLLFVMKDEAGNIISFEDTDLSQEEAIEYGTLLARMIGLNGAGSGKIGAGLEAGSLATAENEYGLTEADIRGIADQIEPGSAAGLLLVEHVWAAGLKHAIRDAGGHMLAQGFLTPEALLMVGQELRAIVEAEAAIELAEAVKGAALLDALITIDMAEAVKEAAIEDAAETVVAAELVKTVAVADAVQTLIVAGLIEDAAARDAVDALVDAGLLDAGAVNQAEDAVAQAEAVAAAAMAEAEQNTEDDDGSTAVGESA